MRYLLVVCTGLLLNINFLSAQAPKLSSSTDIYHSLQKLNFLGSALYIAAHPDDENTRLISYLSNHVKARTAYLSLTRGDGGQNLIGPELRELLGVLRTQELLAARRVDGGEQFFTRANDFGYSKHPDETLSIWNKEEVLGDVVQIIRNFKPDVIINRFNHKNPGSTHGHHTSSAMLSMEAFDLTNNPDAYPSQLKTTEVWQPKRLFFNTSWWLHGSREKFAKADKTNLLSMDVGVYYPLKGVSNNEIASLASSQHLCQGFGRITTRGSSVEYVELLKGDMPKDKTNIFNGINTTWSRMKGGKAIGNILNNVEENFNFKNPSSHLPKLLEAYALLEKSPNSHWKALKIIELKELILAVGGIYLEANANSEYSNPDGTFKVTIEALNRSAAQIKLESATITSTGNRVTPNVDLKNNEKKNLSLTITVPKNVDYTSPYWLTNKGSLGMYNVADKQLIGKPETPRAYNINFKLSINGQAIEIERPVVYHYSRADKGELYQPFEILPEATASFKDKVIVFADGNSKQIPVTIKALKDNVKGEVQLCYSKGWTVENETKPFDILKKGDTKTILFELSPPQNENESFISPILKINGKEISKELIQIAYDHIPTQSVLMPSEAKVVRLNIEKVGENIGYIMGAGDEVPESLEQIGYNVLTIKPEDINAETLNRFDAIVLGIRAYISVPQLKFKQQDLLNFVKNGGNLIVQYNKTVRRGGANPQAPYNLKISYDRVTEENSQVRFLAKDHSIMNYPNEITQKDFENWTQERGLYFPNEWSKEYTPILSMNDKGEAAKEGSLLVAPYGKGNYIYTGLSFFRELPAGVPGAYKIFANMLSLGKDKQQSQTPKKNNYER